MPATLARRTPEVLFERVTNPPGHIDREAGVIRSVKVIGLESANGRVYPAKVLERALDLYEGAKVYMDHPNRRDIGDDRLFRDWCGVLRRVRLECDGVYADIQLRTKSSDYEAILEAATSFPDCFGLSHVADCDAATRDGVDVIEEIREVWSVDIVTEPAATSGLFESVHRQSGSRRSLRPKLVGIAHRIDALEAKQAARWGAAWHREQGDADHDVVDDSVNEYRKKYFTSLSRESDSRASYGSAYERKFFEAAKRNREARAR